jgi:formylglycine-generating enzyme required for sulfatase activity/5,10-methylene-tetrahydrofolate dehydrogenase/methenyl tetrahydrofolate cyclohydrolase
MNMQKARVHNMIAILLVGFCLSAIPGQVAAKESKGKVAQVVQIEKERLVLMPLRVSEDNKNMQAAMETALVQGLQQKYEVFQGEKVAQKAKEIFLKETRNKASNECNEIRCLQNIAEAFQAELIATANITKIEGGYLLSLSIQNIFDNKAVYSNTLPCRDCDAFQVIEKLKVLDNESIPPVTQSANIAVALPANGRANLSDDALWDEVQKSNKVSDYKTYLVQFPSGEHAALAEGRINAIEEQSATDLAEQDRDAWNEAINTSTEAGYQAYLNHYPQGLYIVQANARLKKFQGVQRKIEVDTKPGKVFRDCTDCPEMVILPAGDFNMGSSNGDGDELPEHRVTVKKVFAMGKTEITQGQWKALMTPPVEQTAGSREKGLIGLVEKLERVMPGHRRGFTPGHWNVMMDNNSEYLKNCGENCTEEQKRELRERTERRRDGAGLSLGQDYVEINPSYFKNCGDDCPVEQVNWDDAHEFIQKLNAKTGKQYRLPSEAEWEYACRGGNRNEYCGGDKVESVAWFGAYSNPSGNSGNATHAVARLSANGFGLFDMSGNVWEWVEDGYHTSYNGAPTDGSVWGENANKHTLRGGAWSSKPQEVRASQRSRNEPSSRGSVGFRVVRELP